MRNDEDKGTKLTVRERGTRKLGCSDEIRRRQRHSQEAVGGKRQPPAEGWTAPTRNEAVSELSERRSESLRQCVGHALLYLRRLNLISPLKMSYAHSHAFSIFDDHPYLPFHTSSSSSKHSIVTEGFFPWPPYEPIF